MMDLQPAQEFLQLELAEQTALADAGEAASVFLHELGNVLNNLLLSTKLLQRQLPEEHHPRLLASCELINEVAQQMKQLAQFRQGQRPEPYPVEVNGLIREITAGGPTNRVETDLADSLPPIAATRADCKRLLQMLLQNAIKVSAGHPKPVLVRSHRDGSQVRVVIEDWGPQVEGDRLRYFFEPFQTIRPGQNGLEMAICKNLARRLQGKVEAENRAPEGMTVVASWPVLPG